MTSNKKCQAVPVFPVVINDRGVSHPYSCLRGEECPIHTVVSEGRSVPSIQEECPIHTVVSEGRSVPSIQLSQRGGVSHPYSCLRGEECPIHTVVSEGAHFFLKFTHGTCMYRKRQQEKPLSVTDIFGQQSEMS